MLEQKKNRILMEQESQSNENVPEIQPEGPLSLVTVETVPRTIRMYQVSDNELDNLISSYSSIHSTFFGAALGAAVAIGITLLTVDLGDRAFSSFIFLFALTVVGTIYFFFRWWADRQTAKDAADNIRDR